MWKCCQYQYCQFSIGNWKLGLATLAILATFLSVHAESDSTSCTLGPGFSTSQPFNLSTHSYTNHAGNVVSGVVVALDLRTATISNVEETVALPLSIFPESERRRIAADFVLSHGGGAQTDLLRVPPDVKRTVDGLKKAIARSRKRAALGLCPQEESDDFCEKTATALRSYLDKQVQSGTITPAEKVALWY